MKSFYKFFSFVVIACLLFVRPVFSKTVSQDSVVQVPNVSVVPLVDGKGDDPCWEKAKWQSIDQTWINYGEHVDSTDYSGRFKLLWSSTTNLLYFLVEVTDNVFVDGFIAGKTADIYNYDITEVFIDEDNSGGVHMYDGPGLNAQNAFAYHMYVGVPLAGMAMTTYYIDDMAGTQSNNKRVNYTSHFPELAMRTSGTRAVREFSLIVYNDTYTETNKVAARVQLTTGKEIGLTVAYCDNDGLAENPKVRDNMFGSVWEPSPGNLHWQNANYFGTVKLVSDGSTAVRTEESATETQSTVYPNPASTHTMLHLVNGYHGDVTIRLFNILGQQVLQAAALKMDRSFYQKLSFNHLPAGTYILQTQMGNAVGYQKLLLTY